MKQKKTGNRKDAEWAQAKRLCRLTDEDVRKAKQLSLNPHSLIKNRPSKSQLWKAPVHIWVRELHDRMLERSARKRERKANPSVTGERAKPVVRDARRSDDGITLHQDAGYTPNDPERDERPGFDPALMPEPEWDPAQDGDGDDCPF